jgi:hypothetical protein
LGGLLKDDVEAYAWGLLSAINRGGANPVETFVSERDRAAGKLRAAVIMKEIEGRKKLR